MEGTSSDDCASPARANLEYIPAMDGLRGISVLSVIAFHAGVPFLKGGFIGVEVFFVISGFLITNLMLREYANSGEVSLKRFYMRRVLRLFPALVLFLSVFLVLCAVLFGAQHFKFHLIDALTTLFYSQNWARAYALKEAGLLAHTWSLSIEEQFYVVWPLLLLALLRCVRRSWLLPAVLSLTFCAYLRVALDAGEVSWVKLYHATDTRSNGLLIGCCLGLLVRRNFRVSSAARTPLMCFSLIAALLLGLLSVVSRHSNPAMYQYGFLLVALSSAVILLDLVGSSDTWMAKLLGFSGIVWIGKISYGLYIWHYPIMVLLSWRWSWPMVFVLGTSATFLMASLSYYFVERPFLRMKSRYQGSNRLPNEFPPPVCQAAPTEPDRNVGVGAVTG